MLAEEIEATNTNKECISSRISVYEDHPFFKQQQCNDILSRTTLLT